MSVKTLMVLFASLMMLATAVSADMPKMPPNAMGLITDIRGNSIVVEDQEFLVGDFTEVVDRRGRRLPLKSLRVRQGFMVYSEASPDGSRAPYARRLVKRAFK